MDYFTKNRPGSLPVGLLSAFRESLRPSSEMVGLEQAFNLAAADSEDWSPGQED